MVRSVLITYLGVFAGPAEGTALGSIAAQMIAMGALPDLSSARRAIRQSFDIREFGGG